MEEILKTVQNCALLIQEILYQSPGEYAATTNATGDQQLKADVAADVLIERELAKLACIKEICSEEKSEAVSLSPTGRYKIAYDPLDGSSILGANLSVGTIFGIYDGEFGAENLKAAAYILYGPRLEIVWANVGVELYAYSPAQKRFVFQSTLTLEPQGKLNAPGGTQRFWHPKHRELIESFFQDGYRLRYSGGMVPDLHHILTKGGGIFSYPATSDAPKGKLRMLFEVFPLSFVVEKAGGEAVDGKRRILELPHTHLHDTTPVFLGSKKEIERVRNHYKNL